MRYSVENGYDPDFIDALIQADHDRKYHRCRCSSMSDEMCSWCDGSHDDCDDEDEE